MIPDTVRLLGDPVLRTRAGEVEHFDADLRVLVSRLQATMLAERGIGLAAPQLGVSQRVFTWFVDGVAGHLINPVLDVHPPVLLEPEGCLSVPGIYADCARYSLVHARGFTMHGEPIAITVQGLLARVFQHETDHLDGVLFIDRLDGEAREQALRAVQGAPWYDGQDVRLSPH